MDKIKTVFKYIIWIVLFYIFSNILIRIGLNKINEEGKDETTQTNNLVSTVNFE